MKWVITIGVVLLIICMFLLFRSCNKIEDVSIWGPQYCSLERLEFQEIADTTTVSQDGEMEGNAKANGKATGSNTSIDSLKAELKGGQRAFLHRKTKRLVIVSQKFYEDYSRMRVSICAIVDEVKSDRISNEEGKEKAQELFFEIVRSFSGIDGKKDSPTNNDNSLKLSDLKLEAFFIKKDGTLTSALSQGELDNIVSLRTFPDGEENGLHLQFTLEKKQVDSFKNFQFNFGKPFSDKLGSDRGNPIGWSPEFKNGVWIYKATDFKEIINFEVAYIN